MNMIRRRIVAAVLALAGCLGLSVAMAPAASAGECYPTSYICGKVYNPGYAGSIPFGIIHNWGEGYSQILYAYQESTRFWRDTDGIYVGSGACARVGRWYNDSSGGGYWVDKFYNGPVNVKITNSTTGTPDHVTAWNRRC